MGLMTTVLLVFLNLFSALMIGWWVPTTGRLFVLYILLGLGAVLFYAEELSHRLAWRGHMAYWALSLVNATYLYWITRASGWFLLLLIIDVVALLRALSRLDAQAAGITYPVTFEGKARGKEYYAPSSKLQTNLDDYSSRQSPTASELLEDSDDVIIEDQPEVQVELETYKEGENAIPIIRQRARYDRDIDALMKQVKSDLKRERKIKSKKLRGRPRFTKKKGRKK
ncbi:MAG: hypothetical protein AABX47_03340 [Nanoarchaeota archaeon]